MTDTRTGTESSSEVVLNALWNRGTLIDLSIGKPTFRKKLNSSDLLIDFVDPNAIQMGHKKLLPKTATDSLVSIEANARAFLASRSLKFPISSCRFVYYRALSEVLTVLAQFKVDWETAVGELIANYPALIEQQLTVLNTQVTRIKDSELSKYSGAVLERKTEELNEWASNQRAKNRQLYPSEAKVRDSLRFNWNLFKINSLDGFEQQTTLDAQERVEHEERLKEQMRSWVQEMETDLHKALGSAAANAKDLLAKNGKLTPRNLRPLFEAFEMFKAADFTGNSEFQTAVNTIRERFSVTNSNGEVDFSRTSDALSMSEEATRSFNDLLNSISTLAVEEVAQNAGVRALSNTVEFRRLIEV